MVRAGDDGRRCAHELDPFARVAYGKARASSSAAGTAAAFRRDMTNASNATSSSALSSDASSAMEGRHVLGLTQGIAYIGMGLWPTVSLRSFARVTGPKPEGWLVKAVSFLLLAIGTSMVRGARNGETKSVPTLGIGTGAALGGVAFFYAAKKRISPVYFLDAALHLGFVTAWSGVLALRAARKRRVRVA